MPYTRKRIQLRSIHVLTLSLLISLIMSSGCSDSGDSEISISDGVWLGEAGPDTFAFDFSEDSTGNITGVIHCLSEGRKYSEIPMSTVEWNPPELEIFLGATEVTYRGVMEDSVILGNIIASGAPEMEMNLTLGDPLECAGLYAYTEPWQYRVPDYTDDGWSVSDATQMGFSEESIASLIQSIADGQAGVIHSLIIVQGGQLVLEEYFHGYTRDDLHRLASATKSISSICVGIALDMGFLQSVNQPLNSIFPQAGEDLTLKHVLTMSLGLDWSEEECNMIHGTGEEFFSYILSRSSSIPPGSVFRYTNPDVNLLSGVIHSSSGLFPDEFAERYLFEPLGITDYDWEYSSEDGHRLMDGSLELRPRDMAKIGQLVLQSGVWDGVQVVSDTWLAESTDEHFIVDDDFSYGYLWWLAEIQGEEQQSRVVIAIGIGSQFIAVIPDADTVIVVTGGNEDNGKELIILNLLVELIENSQLH